jgi:DNA-binding MarR family transcriptional regulator
VTIPLDGPTPVGPEGGDVGRTLLDLAPRILRLESNRLALLDVPLTHRQYRILQRVHQGVSTPTAISRAANVSLAAISESVDALCRRGLADRTHDEADRRSSRLSLTREGEAALAAAERELQDLAVLLVEGIDSDAHAELHRQLHRSWANVSTQPTRSRRPRA